MIVVVQAPGESVSLNVLLVTVEAQTDSRRVGRQLLMSLPLSLVGAEATISSCSRCSVLSGCSSTLNTDEKKHYL